jgi:adenine specific DNA methylase Mod
MEGRTNLETLRQPDGSRQAVVAELRWDGKYDSQGSQVAPLRVALPFQTVETINESALERQRSLDFLGGARSDWRNRLIWGDKKYVLPALLEEFAGKIDLIYIDPPFFTGDNFTFDVRVGDSDFTKEPTMIEQRAYRDTWGHGLDSYLGWFYESVVLLRELLTEQGTIFVHLDWHVGHYAKAVLDEVFGIDNFLNEIVWYYYNKLHDSRKKILPRAHDVVFRYANTVGMQTHNALKEARDKPVTKLKYHKVKGQIQNIIGADGKAVTYVSEERTIDDVWRIRALQPANLEENVLFRTQKPVDLLERVLTLGSNPGDLILDCFCGSGTSAVAAERMQRRWIAADMSRFAIHTSRKRLLSVENVKPFVVQNLGKYERQFWQRAEFGQTREAAEISYRHFILSLYKANPISGYIWLHGARNGRMVHVGSVDAPVTAGDVKQIAIEFRRAIGTGEEAPKSRSVDVLGWDFAFELNEVAKQQAAHAGINMRFVRIPREVLDKRAVEQGDIQFFELAALSVDLATKKRSVTVTLTDFIIPLDDVPEDVQRAIKKWEQWIDYWAVDWDNKGDTFHNQWQSFRTRTKHDLKKSANNTYERPGTYSVVVKVIDILGNDTTKTVQVVVA